MRALGMIAVLAMAGCGADAGQTSSTASAAEPVAEQAEAYTEAAPATEAAAFGVGSIAPAFELPGSDGKTHKLADYVGEHVVVAFFPKAFTGG